MKMKRLAKQSLLLLLSLSMVLMLIACDKGDTDNDTKGNTDDDTGGKTFMSTVEEITEELDRMSLTGVINTRDPADGDGRDEDEEHKLTQMYRQSQIERVMTSDETRIFEAMHAVSAERERHLAFGAYVMTNNLESIRIFALGVSAGSAERILRDFWGVVNRESALEQLENLSTANGQSPVADDIFNTLIKNDRFDYIDSFELFLSGFSYRGLENVYNSSRRRAEQIEDGVDILMALLEAEEEDREDLFELLVCIQFADRINTGLEAYIGARDLLIENLGYTEEELLNIQTLKAWDYGRVAIIARYGAEAGYLEEEEAWDYLKIAADRATETYTSWREYTAAHILGRAIAYGNPSDDFLDTLDFLLFHPESSFQTIDFRVS